MKTKDKLVTELGEKLQKQEDDFKELQALYEKKKTISTSIWEKSQICSK